MEFTKRHVENYRRAINSLFYKNIHLLTFSYLCGLWFLTLIYSNLFHGYPIFTATKVIATLVAPMRVFASTFDHKSVLAMGEKRADVAQAMFVHLAIEVDEVGVHCVPFGINDSDAPVSTVVECMSDEGYARAFEG